METEIKYKTVVLTEIPNDKVSIKDVGANKFYGIQFNGYKAFIICRKRENGVNGVDFEYIIQKSDWISIDSNPLKKDIFLERLIANAISQWKCDVYEFNNVKDLYKWLSED